MRHNTDEPPLPRLVFHDTSIMLRADVGLAPSCNRCAALAWPIAYHAGVTVLCEGCFDAREAERRQWARLATADPGE